MKWKKISVKKSHLFGEHWHRWWFELAKQCKTNMLILIALHIVSCICSPKIFSFEVEFISIYAIFSWFSKIKSCKLRLKIVCTTQYFRHMTNVFYALFPSTREKNHLAITLKIHWNISLRLFQMCAFCSWRNELF